MSKASARRPGHGYLLAWDSVFRHSKRNDETATLSFEAEPKILAGSTDTIVAGIGDKSTLAVKSNIRLAL